MRAYRKILELSSDALQELSEVLMTVFVALFTGVLRGYHAAKDKYVRYKYSSSGDCPTVRYFLTEDSREEYDKHTIVPHGLVYVEEWVDTKGHKKARVLYEDQVIPRPTSPFSLPSARCPWVWVGDLETEIDLTRTFDKFLVPNNRITQELVSRLVKITDHTNLIYVETRTFNRVKFPGDGIIIHEDTDEPLSDS
jgi:hypothetical protein